MEFKAGDLVRLKSGSTLMTVESVGEAFGGDGLSVYCVWAETKSGRQEVM